MYQRVAIGLGSNVGDSPAHLAAAVDALRLHPEISNLVLSTFLTTSPVGVLNQPDFLNAAATFHTSLAPAHLMELLVAIERDRGRDRMREQRWGPRTLDVDLLLYGGNVITLDSLQVPHPRMKERRFVLQPLAEIASDWLVPPHNQTVGQLLAALPPL